MTGVTGRELRNVLEQRELTPNQFIERAAKEIEKAGNATRDSGRRAAKRWLSKRKRDEELRFRQTNRLIVAKILQIPPSSLEPADGPGRLEELAEKLTVVEDIQARLLADLDDARTRIERLEGGRARPRAAPRHRRPA